MLQPPIRAFVGHSFTSEDSQVVRTFLDFLTTITQTLPGFSWVHAEGAEPKLVTEKVLSLLQESNLFIAVCTRKERVIADEKLVPAILNKNRLSGDAKEYQWKTSDWIIQEIGLAVGRGLKLVLLLEDGVRSPGALQGNLEYIPFHRDSPEKCFPKLMEMISSASGKHAPITADDGSGVVSAPRENETSRLIETVQGEAKKDEWVPKPGWKTRDYEWALLHLLTQGNEEKTKELSEAYLATEIASESGKRNAWLALLEYWQIALQGKGSLSKLQSLARENPENSEILIYLGRAYAYYEDHKQAATAFERAARAATELSVAVTYFGEAACASQQANDKQAALRLISIAKEKANQVEDQEIEMAVLRAEQRLAKLQDEEDVLLGAMERLLEIDPSNTSLRFDLAYKHSQVGSDALATLHYLRIPASERSEATWNNVGVAYEALAMPAKAVNAYRNSEEKAGTLAMSNLANKLMTAGFLNEAKALCEKALTFKGYDKNVDKSLVRLKEIPDEEDKQEKEALSKAKDVSAFYQLVGKSLLLSLPEKLPNLWKGPDCDLHLQSSGGVFRLAGEFERKGNALGLGIFSNAGSEAAVNSFQVVYEGRMRGKVMIGTVSRGLKGGISSLLGGADEKPTVIIVIGEDGKEMSVLERKGSAVPKCYKFSSITMPKEQ